MKKNYFFYVEMKFLFKVKGVGK